MTLLGLLLVVIVGCAIVAGAARVALHAGSRHDRCLANIAELEQWIADHDRERERVWKQALREHFGQNPVPSNFHQVVQEAFFFGPGQQWIVEDPTDIQVYTPMQQDIIDTSLAIENDLERRGMIESGAGPAFGAAYRRQLQEKRLDG